MRVLAADLGGTKTLLAIAEPAGDDWRIIHRQRLEAAAFDGFDALLSAFLSDAGDAARALDRACIAVAGPLSADATQARVTNLGWRLDTAALSARLGGCAVQLINDFSAVGHGIDRLTAADLMTLQAGCPRRHAPRIVLGPGTGLGTGLQVWCGDDYSVLPSEGGHVDFAPIGAVQRELLGWLEQRLSSSGAGGHVSVERVVSGPGLVTLFEFLCQREPARVQLSPATVHASADAAAAITGAALGSGAAGRDALASEALDLMIAILGAHAGNLALIALPWGGLYLAGGIAPKIIDRLRDGPFLAAFNDKGRMSHLTAAVPLAVVRNPDVGLLGALQVARTRPPGNRS